MDLSLSQSNDGAKWGTILKRGLLAFIIILFFCDIAIYLSLAVSPRLEPQYWIALLAVLAAVLAWVSPGTRWEVFRTPLFFWCVFFIVLTIIFFAVVRTSHVEQLKEQVRTVVLLVVFLGVFLMLKNELGFTRKLVLLAVLFGVVINLVSLVHQNFLRPPNVIFGYRPGGFYINPNESAIALIFGMVLSVDTLPRRWREPYVVIVLAGVIATFSREAMLGWLVVVASLCAFKVLGWKNLAVYTLALAVCAAVAVLIAVKAHLISEATLNFYVFTLRRFTGFFRERTLDESDRIRLDVLKMGWAYFLTHPWIGNGIGSTYHWSLPASTHNMYLLYMDDYGVIGVFLYPLLIWCAVRRAAGEARNLVHTMAIFLLFWGFFDHNIVQNYYSLFAISLTAAISRISVSKDTLRLVFITAEAPPD